MPDSCDPENSQMTLVLGGPVIVARKGQLGGLSQGHQFLGALAPSRKPCLGAIKAFPAYLDSACVPVHEPPGPKASVNTSLPPSSVMYQGGK